VTLGYLAALTERIRLATYVLVLGYHHPLEIVKRYGTLDVVSRGRLVLGVGVGSLEEEFALLGRDFKERGARAADALRAIRSSFAAGGARVPRCVLRLRGRDRRAGRRSSGRTDLDRRSHRALAPPRDRARLRSLGSLRARARGGARAARPSARDRGLGEPLATARGRALPGAAARSARRPRTGARGDRAPCGRAARRS
jgi:alkanesulfonate monooxygenase SsuD/methylene tetrahydromethanopterin reductase-like flavin-dependent oxidoreductase (luciferase family)